MPQARLPDINTAFIKYRNEFVSALKRKDYDNMHGALGGLNGLLPEEYRVIISTGKYEELTKTDIEYECSVCTIRNNKPVEIPKEELTIFVQYPNSMQRLLFGGSSEKVWQCPKCQTIHRLSDTNISETKLQNPYFLGVVPDPPEKKVGLIDHLRFDIMVKQWAWQMMNELEHKMAKFRDDNWSRGEEMGGLDDIDTSAEEES